MRGAPCRQIVMQPLPATRIESAVPTGGSAAARAIWKLGQQCVGCGGEPRRMPGLADHVGPHGAPVAQQRTALATAESNVRLGGSWTKSGPRLALSPRA